MRILIATILAFSLSATVATAQNTGSGAAAKSSSSSSKATGAAPVGHRQPTAADVGSEKNPLDVSAEDKALDRKIKGICRGC